MLFTGCLKHSIFGVLCSVLLLFSTQARAWYDIGHMLVGQLAYEQVQKTAPELIRELDALLTAAGRYYQSQQFDSGQFATIGKAATFLDTYKTRHPKTKHWHYPHLPYVPKGQYQSVSMSVLMTEAAKTPNTLTRISLYRGVLKKNSNDIKHGTIAPESVAAFTGLLHLVGDLYQPLHAIQRFDRITPRGDGGGKLFRVTCASGVIDLHGYWDAMDFQFGQVRWDDPEYAVKMNRALDKIRSFIGESPRYPSHIRSLSQTLNGWKIASAMNKVAQTLVYEGVERGKAVSPEYRNKVRKYSQYFIYMAGQQLAMMLIDALSEERAVYNPTDITFTSAMRANNFHTRWYKRSFAPYLKYWKAVEAISSGSSDRFILKDRLKQWTDLLKSQTEGN